MIRILAPVLLALHICGCAVRPAPEPDEHCQTLYTPLPGTYIINLTAGDETWLNPQAHDFILYCSAQGAWQAIESRTDVYPPGGDWRVFELEGDLMELARKDEQGKRHLKSPAKAITWIEKGQ